MVTIFQLISYSIVAFVLPVLLYGSETWISEIQEDVNMSARSYWDASTRRGHGRMTQRSFMTTRS